MSSDQASSINKGKGPDASAQNGNSAGFRSHANMVAVQPPKPEDLQRSYATVVDSDANPKGWYGSMSMCNVLLYLPTKF